jgi:hypothetical protein
VRLLFADPNRLCGVFSLVGGPPSPERRRCDSRGGPAPLALRVRPWATRSPIRQIPHVPTRCAGRGAADCKGGGYHTVAALGTVARQRENPAEPIWIGEQQPQPLQNPQQQRIPVNL